MTETRKPGRTAKAGVKLALVRKAPARQVAPKKTVAQAAGSAQVDAYMKTLIHPLKAEMTVVREIIRRANRKLAERVKWNAPSFYYRADMAAFNPRSTRFVQVIFVFPRGLLEEDGGGLLQGNWKDRREARFHDMRDVLSKRAGLRRVVNAWVARMEEKSP